MLNHHKTLQSVNPETLELSITPQQLRRLFMQERHHLRKAAAVNHPLEKQLLARLDKVGLIAQILDFPEGLVRKLLQQHKITRQPLELESIC